MHSQDGVRAAVEDVSRELALASRADAQGITARLQRAWGRLVDELALGPAPEYRACPHCGAAGMRLATRCWSCWAVLTPPAEARPVHGPTVNRLQPAANLPKGFDEAAAAALVRRLAPGTT